MLGSCIYACIGRPEVDVVSSTVIFEIGSLTEACLINYAVWLVSSRNLPVSGSPKLDLQVCTRYVPYTHPLCGCWEFTRVFTLVQQAFY